MEIEICTVSGYTEVGKNMTAIRIDDEVIICDIGIFLPPIIGYEGEDHRHLSADQMINLGAIPNDSVIAEWKGKVKAIVLGHCHLDHIAGIQYLAAKYRAPIIGSPFTTEVLKSILRDDDIKLPNKIRILNLNSKIKISKNITIELIEITHSTPQSCMIAIHTPKGIVLYACDFKFDSTPTMGNKADFKKLREIGKEGVLVLICESLYSMRDMKTPSEKVARELLKEVMLGVDTRGKAVFVTTFASHIARIKSTIEFAKK
ncbi:MAG: MBL fold metallo-hydrolase, partial [Nanoarchaeota archaeon]|nr:MBL fold metallo-hydrolase [Nanoarchaeota archaeon]